LIVGDFLSVIESFDFDKSVVFVLGGLSSSESEEGGSQVESNELKLTELPRGSASVGLLDSSGGGDGFGGSGLGSSFLFHI
jgi:hypothetical protein